jgi:hypothetical protein
MAPVEVGMSATLIGRIGDHASDWEWISAVDEFADVELGDRLRFKYHQDAEWRVGEAAVFAKIDRFIYLDSLLRESVPAIADLDYVYRVEPERGDQ